MRKIFQIDRRKVSGRPSCRGTEDLRDVIGILENFAAQEPPAKSDDNDLFNIETLETIILVSRDGDSFISPCNFFYFII